MAGSYAERIPVIAITGAPTRAVEQGGKYVHHSLGEGTFDDYRKMFAHITVAQGYITPENATTEIPRLINTAIAEDAQFIYIYQSMSQSLKLRYRHHLK
ncbi:hypothetical protein ACVQ90_14600 [Staphylococcus aureus]